MSMDATRLGTATYNAVNALGAGDTEDDAKARHIAIAQCFIDEITANATIAPLLSTDTPIIGTSIHSHMPVTTAIETGKIS